MVELLVKIMSRMLPALWVGGRGFELVCDVSKRIWRMIDPNNMKFARFLNSHNIDFIENFKKRRRTEKTGPQPTPEVPVV